MLLDPLPKQVRVDPIALLPFTAAFWVWSAAKLFCWLFVVYSIRPRSGALLLALSAPPVVYDFLAGQSSLLAAALFGGALVLLDRRPIISGFLVALLIFKPQYGVLLPLVLIATGRWNVVIMASLVAPALLLLSGTIFGWDTCTGFREAATFATTQFHLTGALPWYKLQSIYGLFRLAGFGYGLAMSLQILVASAAAVWALIMWRRNVGFVVKAACLLAATPLISPYFAIYDMQILVIALVFVTGADGITSPSNQRSFRFAVCIMFLLGYAFPITLVPVGPFMCATLIAVIWMRLRQLDASGTIPVRS
ncbi:hypothetical protein ACVIWU_004951 [Bradyrhizobium sp. USDA 4509]